LLRNLKPKSEFSRNVLTLMTGTTIAQAIPIAISPILTRIYTPEDFGVFAVFIAISALFVSFVSGRYEFALLLPEKDEDAINILSLGFLITIVVTFFSLFIIEIFYDLILQNVEHKEISFWLFMIPVIVFFTGLFNLLTYYHNRKKNYKELASASVGKAVVMAFVQITVGILKSGATGLISGQIVAQISVNIKLLKAIFKDRLLLSSINRTEMILLAKKYIDFPKYQAPHALFNTISSNIPIYMFTMIFSSSVVGFYALSTRIVFAPFMLITGSVGKIYSQKVSELYYQKLDAYEMTVKLIRTLSLRIFIPFLLLVFFSPEIFSIIFGEQWREAGIYTQILSVWLFLNILVSTVSFIPSLINKQKKAFMVSIIQVFLLVLSLSIGGYYEDIYLSLTLFALSNSIILIYNLSWMLKGLRDNQTVYEGRR